MYIDVRDYRIVNEALEELYGELASQNRIATEAGAPVAPFGRQLDRLSQMIQWGKRELSGKDDLDLISDDLSEETVGYINAALQIARYRVREKARKWEDEGRPPAVVGAILRRAERYSRIEKFFPGPPADILWELIPGTGRDMAKTATTHVFISYVREDEPLVNRIADTLRTRGINVWLDRDSIAPGSRWKREIRRAITEGGFFVACFSAEYSSRGRTYMNEELTIAIEELRQRPADRAWFIPIKLSACRIPDRDIGAGKTLRDIQWLDLWRDWDSGMERLLEILPLGGGFHQ